MDTEGGLTQCLRMRTLAGLLGVCIASSASAQTVVLYANDFEHPNVTPAVNCGNSLDTRGIDLLYGAPGFRYQQTFTVEAVLISDAQGLYTDPSGVGGAYALGLLSTAENDLLALTFDRQGRQFLNVGLDLSAIDVFGCGGPFGVAQPELRLSLYDSPDGFSFAAPGTLLDQAVFTSTAPPSASEFRWQYGLASLDASAATTGTVTVVFDLIASGYAAFDNLSIIAADETGIGDRDTDGVPDDTDNCPDVDNADQGDRDHDTAGDPCDPAPDDPSVCGDRDGDGEDDCAGFDAGVPEDAGQPSDDAATPDTGATTPDTGVDAGVANPDAGVASPDAGVTDAGVTGEDEGCGCTDTRNRHDTSLLVTLVLLGLVPARRRLARFSS